MWRLLAEMPAEELVASIDFHHISDAITPADALELLEKAAPGYAERLAVLERDGFPGLHHLGRLARLPGRQGPRADPPGGAPKAGRAVKMKVGGDIADDVRRARIIREEIGPDALLMMDANQVWDVDEAIANMAQLAEVDPYWIEEPTHADDVLGPRPHRPRVASYPVGDAASPPARSPPTGSSSSSCCRPTRSACARSTPAASVASTRCSSMLLMAAKFGVPVCPHAGGVGLCEYVQHLSIFDYLRVGASLDGRMVEYVDHLHEHFVGSGRRSPVAATGCRPRPGTASRMKPASIAEFSFPDGPAWR